ncbi:carbohydrate ABC transporter permease [Microbacterium sp. NPDC077663]|uniref:carbohydrate ABC transporter permease n=1 Tax=Microbacterium sp. NPDC077663 TaxID=3364189 RepID=UPI0037C7A7A6
MTTNHVGVPRRARLPIGVGLVLIALTIVYPVVYLATAAFRTKADYLANPFGLPSEWTFQNFIVLWNNYDLGIALRNSVVVVIIGLTLQLGIAMLAGYALARLDVPGARAINATFVSVMLIPSQVLIIPIYLLLSRIGMVGSLQGLILVYVATGLPFAVFFMTAAFSGVDQNVLEAATVDGAGFWRTLLSVASPMAAPGIATLAVLQFLGMWNELLFAYILLPDNDLRLLTPALAQIGGRFTSDQPLVSAGLIVTALFPMLLLAFASRYVMSGLAASFGR